MLGIVEHSCSWFIVAQILRKVAKATGKQIRIKNVIELLKTAPYRITSKYDQN